MRHFVGLGGTLGVSPVHIFVHWILELATLLHVLISFFFGISCWLTVFLGDPIPVPMCRLLSNGMQRPYLPTGTGLLGEQLRDWAPRAFLEGLDLSAAILQQAEHIQQKHHLSENAYSHYSP